jgi:hypothetical protein
MAQTRGFVHRLKVTSPSILAWVYVGPTATDTELLLVMAPLNLSAVDAAYRASMADALAVALSANKEVVAFHPDNSAEITSVHMPPL